MKNTIKYTLIFLLFTGCFPSQKIPKDAKMTDYFYFQGAGQMPSDNWVVFLPGTGGLKIFEDTQHYFNISKKLNDAGFSVLLVDYVAAYKASGRKTNDDQGQRIVWTLEQALDWAKKSNKIMNDSHGSVVGWSLAGTGLILVANNAKEITKLNLKSMVLFYPANGEKIQLESDLPILILTGKADNIVKAEDVKKYWNSPNTKIVMFENAYHGFDVESLKEGKSLRFPPLIGKKFTLEYNEKAANKSIMQLIDFLKGN